VDQLVGSVYKQRMRPAVTSRAVLALALPAMATNVATAAIGVVDTWVIGQLGDPVQLAAVGMGGTALLVLLGMLNFLRMGTVGLTAQAMGADDPAEAVAVLLRACAIGVVLGAVLLLARPLLLGPGLSALGGEPAVQTAAATYVGIRLWAAPLFLLNYALVGFLIGQARPRPVLAVEIAYNLVNAGLSLWLGLGLGCGIAGVALASALAEAVKLLLLVGAIGAAHSLLARWRGASVWQRTALLRLFAINRDLFVRTLLLVGVFAVMTRTGAEAGAVTLAANTVLLQFFYVAAFALDGFESAAQTLGGQRFGARDQAGFGRAAWLCLALGGVAALAISLVYALAGPWIVGQVAKDAATVATALHYLPWAAAIPLIAVWCFVYDGLFIGATWSRAMLVTMGAGVAAFALLLWGFEGQWGNHALWLAFAGLMAVRGVGQALALPKLSQRAFERA
jgi:multidrug resistance protein, MATE family